MSWRLRPALMGRAVNVVGALPSKDQGHPSKGAWRARGLPAVKMYLLNGLQRKRVEMYLLTTFTEANHDPRSLGGNTAICLGKRGGVETACDKRCYVTTSRYVRVTRMSIQVEFKRMVCVCLSRLCFVLWGPGLASPRRILWVGGCVSLCSRPSMVSHTTQLA